MTRQLNVSLVQMSPYKHRDVPQALYIEGELATSDEHPIPANKILELLRTTYSTEGETHTFDPHMYYTKDEPNISMFPKMLEDAIKSLELEMLY